MSRKNASRPACAVPRTLVAAAALCAAVSSAESDAPVGADGACDALDDSCNATYPGMTGRTEVSSSVHVFADDDAGPLRAPQHPAPPGYSGEMSPWTGRPHGVGALETDECSYAGQFEDGLFHGRGTAVWSDNGTFVGDFRRGLPHGNGRHVEASGATFWGGWADGRWHGLGVRTTADGATVFGEWDSGVSLGRGVEIRDPGWLLGSAAADRAAAAASDDGRAPRKTKRGQGLCTFENGDAYVGQWVAEKKKPKGGDDGAGGGSGDNEDASRKRKSGGDNTGSCVWERDPGGEWQAGATVSFTGSGFYKFANGDYYAGEFSNMARNGRGTYVGVDGGRYAGGWRAGKYHGLGTLQLPEGKGVQAGRWESNRFVGDLGDVAQLLPGDAM